MDIHSCGLEYLEAGARGLEEAVARGFVSWVLLSAMSPNIGDPDVIRSLALSPFSRRFNRLCADNVKS
jgi:hypothetical protein